MSTGQMLITAVAMVLLSLLVLRVGGTSIITQESMQNSKFGVLATSLANSIMEEASMKFFDEKSAGNYVANLTDLTPISDLGVDSGEHPDSIHTFNDFDDFHGFTHTYDNLPSAVFTVSCIVNYVDPDLPGLISANRTWHKMITVTISSPSIVKPGTDEVQELVFRKVFSYWKYL